MAAFAETIQEMLAARYGTKANEIREKSLLIQYLIFKTKSAGRGSKSRANYANLYALYVLVEDDIQHEFTGSGEYANYAGARYSDLLRRQRQLPFGEKLQNHGLNGRLNDEFRKFFPADNPNPIMRRAEDRRYWINETYLLITTFEGTRLNIAQILLDIIDAYIAEKRRAFGEFLRECQALQTLQTESREESQRFIKNLLRPSVDARLFEIVSFAILKTAYRSQFIYWGWSEEKLQRDALTLYKTGRTNANDGGIDFVMRPLGRFFQVTETVDVRKYFLDIEKVRKFPLTFVVKSSESVAEIEQKIREQAEKQYPVRAFVETYMACIEEIINIETLLRLFDEASANGKLSEIMDEIMLQSRTEFNYEEESAGEEQA